MKDLINRLRTTRLGFLIILLILLWAKTEFAYYVDFTLGTSGLLQQIIQLINPLGLSALFLSLALYVKKARPAYITAIVIYLLMTVLVFVNVLYYREFTDFMSVQTMLGVSKVTQGLGTSTINMMIPRDLVYWFDVVLVLLAYLGYGIRNVWRYIHHESLVWPHFGLKVDTKPVTYHLPQAVSLVAVACFGVTMAISELNRPQLLTRNFDHNYTVKYLGLVPFTAYDGFQTARNSQVRASADSADMDKILQYTRSHYAAPNVSYYGTAKGKNVIIIHMESFQQFLIGQKVDGQEVTPFLNSLIKQKDTLSFDNFYHQVGNGKTSDAENMLETSTFGLSSGSLFTALGTDNTFQGAPSLLQQYAGYTSAVFHGGLGTFWNRNNVYKSLGYNYFFDGNFYNHDADTRTAYGIKDKLMFGESIKYMEHLQQPFYAKVITTTNHYPFFITDEDSDFPEANTDDAYIKGYFRTAHYLDQALSEFFAYLKTSGLEKNSIVMLYGDHFGLSDDRNKDLASLLTPDSNPTAAKLTNDATPDDWNAFDNAQLQRVPLIFHMPGLKGGVNHTYGGEIDVLPTLLHLLGVKSNNFVQFGTDLLSPQHDTTIAFRNHDFVTPRYTVLSGVVYDNKTGQIVKLSAADQATIDAKQQHVNQELSLSDTLANKNLLRFYVPKGYTPVNPDQADFSQSLAQMMHVEQEAGKKSTSLFSKNHDQSTVSDFSTDAPEVANDPSALTTYPDKVAGQANGDVKRTTQSSK
ncbi:phosphoglycerol transferase alkaline phosphatase superfamily protein [Lacticaseibacillus camelliae DSM 22697 = JCM 13995]|uniref:Phosphoglycerol transferase alkaline phosphatase superfamily protein n=1 Tax=Lacticaseibacillus camelliae DSM 22697 = JCM 13995 TaxID=1423730 RepID=A0A0R2F9W7_9LACO|nr:phosphoglycerol transferase alkaline phosphatase superfamily protein [Lacticaseibacillus camelliae DSM 22697 = JCM 13995]